MSVLLVFQETFGGLHKKYNVQPDIAIFGKALGNGCTITSVVEKNVMEFCKIILLVVHFGQERMGSSAALKSFGDYETRKKFGRELLKKVNI